MSYGRTLDRGLDLDLIERLEASGRSMPMGDPRKLQSARKPPRGAHTYRGAIRNERRVIRAAQLAAKRARQAEQRAKT